MVIWLVRILVVIVDGRVGAYASCRIPERPMSKGDSPIFEMSAAHELGFEPRDRAPPTTLRLQKTKM